jgi:hypothetical protein
VVLKFNGTHQLPAYANDVNLMGDNIDTKKKIKETLSDSGKEVSLEISIEKPKYMLLSCHQNINKDREIKITNRSCDIFSNDLHSCGGGN